MACGRPVVVSSNVGCAPDLVNEDNGAVVPPEDTMALREALESLLSDPKERRRMGERSADRIHDWSIEEAASRTAEAVNTAVSTAP
jgi:glycosyltransferase involved in cell wall biosynthesis